MNKAEAIRISHEYRLSLESDECRCGYDKCDIEDAFIAGIEHTEAKAKEAFDKACGWLSTYPWYQGVVDEFVKAMEEQV